MALDQLKNLYIHTFFCKWELLQLQKSERRRMERLKKMIYRLSLKFVTWQKSKEKKCFICNV